MPNAKVANTLWKDVDDETAADTKTLFEPAAQQDLIAMFRADQPASGGAAKPKKEKKKPEVKEVSFLEGKRQNEVGLLMGRIKLSNDALKAAIQAGDEEVVEEDTLRILQQVLPSAEEEQAIEGFIEGGGNREQLVAADKIVLALHEVPACAHRVNGYLFAIRFPPRLEALQDDVATLKGFCADAKSPLKFKRVLEIVLRIGNYMNGVSMRGGASGFKVASLCKLKDVKSTAGESKGMTLLEFVVKMCASQHPDLLGWVEELKSVAAAERLSIAQLEADLRDMQSNVKEAEKAVPALRQAEAATQADELEALCAEMTKQTAELAKTLEEVAAQGEALLTQYGEEGRAASLDALCETLSGFRGQWLGVVAELEAEKAAEEKREKRRAARAGPGGKGMPGMGAMMGELAGALAARPS